MSDGSFYALIEEIGAINLDLYRGFFDSDILTDVLVLTRNRAEHIDERRYGVLQEYKANILDTVNDPDLVIRDDKHIKDTVISIREVKNSDSDKKLYVVIKFNLEGNNPEYKNSIMTMTVINEKKFNQIKRNKTIIYEKL